MKIPVLIFTLLSSIASFAQTVGVEAGLAFSSYEAESNRQFNPNAPRTNISSSPKPGLILGAHADLKFSQHLYLRTGLLAVAKGGKEKGLYTDVNGTSYLYSETKNFFAFDIPVSLLYKTAGPGQRRLVFGAGLIPGLLVEGGLDELDLGVGVLAGYETPTGLHYNLSYNRGLQNMATQSFDYRSLRNRSAALTIGYHFRHKTAEEKERIKAREKESGNLQQSTRVLYAELGSPAGLFTVNYDARLSKSNRGLGIRVGAGAIFDASSLGFTLPVTLNYLFGQRTHYFELAAGASYFSFRERNQDSWFNFTDENFVVPFVWAGYRYQPAYKKFFFRAGIGQPIGIDLPVVFRVPSLSFGYSLR